MLAKNIIVYYNKNKINFNTFAAVINLYCYIRNVCYYRISEFAKIETA